MDGNYPSTLPAFLSEFLTMGTIGPVHLWIWKLKIQPANCTLIEGTWTSAVLNKLIPTKGLELAQGCCGTNPHRYQGWPDSSFWILVLPLSTVSPQASYLNLDLSFICFLYESQGFDSISHLQLLSKKESIKSTVFDSSPAAWASLVAQAVHNLPAMQDMQVQSLGWEESWRRKWQTTPVLLSREFHGQRSLLGYSPAVAAAKSLQSCPTLCDPRDGRPPGSPVPGILQARTLE